MAIETRQRMAKRAAKEIRNGMVVNLGIGIPSLVPDHLATGLGVMFHAENGIVGMGGTPETGQEDENLCNAGGFPVTTLLGSSYFDSAVAFGMIRKGLIDLSILGSLQVSRKGDLANWIIPGKKVPGMGGAMELAGKARKLIVLMSHTDRNGSPKILDECTLPLTALQCVDMIITDMAVFTVEQEELYLKEVFAPYSLDEIASKTGCQFAIEDTVIKIED
ncbi:3-oxoacid CoA-transferase subunit B [Mesobacillus zeae]